MKIKIKKLHPNAVIPRYAKQGDAGMDLTVCWRDYNHNTGKLKVGFGLAFEIPEGYVGLVFPRSSIHNTGLMLSNCVGVIDSGYRGEVTAVFNASSIQEVEEPIYQIINGYSACVGRQKRYNRPYDNDDFYQVGQRAAQIIIMPYPEVEFEEVEELSTTERGVGGYGSTGK